MRAPLGSAILERVESSEDLVAMSTFKRGVGCVLQIQLIGRMFEIHPAPTVLSWFCPVPHYVSTVSKNLRAPSRTPLSHHKHQVVFYEFIAYELVTCQHRPGGSLDAKLRHLDAKESGTVNV